MFSVMFSVLAIFVSLAHAEPARLSQETVTAITQVIDRLQTNSEQICRRDPLGSASIVDQIADIEMKADESRYHQSIARVQKLVADLQGRLFRDVLTPKSTSSDRSLNELAKLFEDQAQCINSQKKESLFRKEDLELAERACRHEGDSMDSIQKDAVLMVNRAQSEVNEMAELLQAKEFPLSLKGPIENIAENSTRLFDLIRDAAGLAFKTKDKNKNEKYMSTIAGNGSSKVLRDRIAHLREELKDAGVFYLEKGRALSQAVYRRDLCPTIGEQRRKIEGLLKNPTPELAKADADLQRVKANRVSNDVLFLFESAVSQAIK